MLQEINDQEIVKSGKGSPSEGTSGLTVTPGLFYTVLPTFHVKGLRKDRELCWLVL